MITLKKLILILPFNVRQLFTGFTNQNPAIVKTVILKGIDVSRLDSEGHPGPFYLLDMNDEDTVIKILDILVSAGFDLNIRGTCIDGRKVNTILGDFVSSIF